MAISFYDASVGGYLQTLGAMGGILDKGFAHFTAEGRDPDAVVGTTLHPDMRPFRYQIRSVVHHSLGALEGLRDGTFAPPGRAPEIGYVELQALVHEARASLAAAGRDEVEALADGEVVFSASDRQRRFTAQGFLLSFSLPNLHFHATTAYDILRMAGVPLGKRDYLGRLR